jgi:hypothetical protein
MQSINLTHIFIRFNTARTLHFIFLNLINLSLKNLQGRLIETSRVLLGGTLSSMSFHDEIIMADFAFVTAKYIYLRGRIRTYIHTHIHTLTYIHTYIHTHTHSIYTHNTYIHTHTHSTHTHTHTHTAHIHIQALCVCIGLYVSVEGYIFTFH